MGHSAALRGSGDERGVVLCPGPAPARRRWALRPAGGAPPPPEPAGCRRAPAGAAPVPAQAIYTPPCDRGAAHRQLTFSTRPTKTVPLASPWKSAEKRGKPCSIGAPFPGVLRHPSPSPAPGARGPRAGCSRESFCAPAARLPGAEPALLNIDCGSIGC